MPRWKENHYTRAADFARLLGTALGRAAAAPEAPASTPAPAPAPAATPPPAAKPGAAPGPSAASVFTAIPWKK